MPSPTAHSPANPTSPFPTTPPMQRSTRSPQYASQGEVYPLMLEHVFDNPGSFKIPLRTMYLTNASAQDLLKQWSTSTTIAMEKKKGLESPAGSASSRKAMTKQQAATAQFITSLMDHVSHLPSQPCTLPPSFLSTFLRKCFPVDLHLVDFPQALVGIDYLHDLDLRRCKEISTAKRKLGAGLSHKSGLDSMAKLSPGIATWIHDMENSERKAEALFTQLYVALRRWVLINELSLLPFNRHNALAMLNTLYPPFAPSQSSPTAALTPSVLAKQRTGFLTYISAVEARGTGVLKPLMDQGKRPGIDPDGSTGWPGVSAALDHYLRITKRIIEDCSCITTGADLDALNIEIPSTRPPSSAKLNKKRQADSGVSFGGTSQHSRGPSYPRPNSQEASARSSLHSRAKSSTSSAASSFSPGDRNKPLPSPPVGATVFTSPTNTNQAIKNFSRVEQLAFELRKMKLGHSRSNPSLSVSTNGVEDQENTDLSAIKTLTPANVSPLVEGESVVAGDDNSNGQGIWMSFVSPSVNRPPGLERSNSNVRATAPSTPSQSRAPSAWKTGTFESTFAYNPTPIVPLTCELSESQTSSDGISPRACFKSLTDFGRFGRHRVRDASTMPIFIKRAKSIQVKRKKSSSRSLRGQDEISDDFTVHEMTRQRALSEARTQREE